MPEQTPHGTTHSDAPARYVTATRPGSPHEDYLICVAQTAVVAIMATILKAADKGTGHRETDEVAVGLARKLYHETIRQMWGPSTPYESAGNVVGADQGFTPTTNRMTTPLGSSPPTNPA